MRRFALPANSPANVAALGDFLQVALPNQILKIDPASGETVETFATEFAPGQMLVDGDDLSDGREPRGGALWARSNDLAIQHRNWGSDRLD